MQRTITGVQKEAHVGEKDDQLMTGQEIEFWPNYICKNYYSSKRIRRIHFSVIMRYKRITCHKRITQSEPQTYNLIRARNPDLAFLNEKQKLVKLLMFYEHFELTKKNKQKVLFTNPSARAGYDTRSISKRSLTGFEFLVFLLLD